MATDRDKLQFYSPDKIDKIVEHGTKTIINDGNTTSSGTSQGPQLARVVTGTSSHSYTRAPFIRCRWNVDGGSWNGLEAEIMGSFTITYTDVPVTSPPLQILRAAVSIGADENTVYFMTANGDHGNQSTVLASPNTGYTPVSHTFNFEYWLFERD